MPLLHSVFIVKVLLINWAKAIQGAFSVIVKLQTSRRLVYSSNLHSSPAQDREPAPEPGVEDGDDGFQSFHNQWTPMLGVDFDDDRDTGTTETVTVFNHVFVEEVDYDKEGDPLLLCCILHLLLLG